MADDNLSTILVFFVNGKKVEDSSFDPEITLLSYLRNKPSVRLCGTKLGCAEGGCGACTVMISKYNPQLDKVEHYSVNACLVPVASVHGLAVTTVEGIGSTRTRLHAVQERIAKAHGSQCGFCTPGMVMSMYTLLRNNPVPSMSQIDEYFTGNLCRCTGYRPILDGFCTLTSDAQMNGGCGKKNCCKLNESNRHDNDDEKDSGSEENTTYEKDADVAEVLFEKHDFEPYDPTQEIIFPPELKLGKTTLDLSHISGVEVKLKKRMYPVLVNPTNVPELTVVELKDSGVLIGASVTLSTIEIVLRNLIRTQSEHTTRIYSAILEMLRWFGGKQIRNTAVSKTIGGNIMAGSSISDLNPLLMTADVSLKLCSKENGEREVIMNHDFFTGYKRNIVLPDEILISVHIPYTKEDEYFFGYKQAKRRGEDIAIVNAGMKVIFEPQSAVVKKLDLAFGGMAPTTVMATNTMASMAGKMWDTSLLETATTQILEEIPLSPSAPGGMIDYRRALTVSFFMKFYLSVRGRLSERFPEVIDHLTIDEQRAVKLHEHKPAKSSQMFEIVPRDQNDIDPVGRPMIHASALKQATGEAVYVDDMPRYENELFAALVLSTKAHAKIISVDESEALVEDGVERFICARDIPCEEQNRIGCILQDEEVFASKEVTCFGQVIGLILAKDQPTAQRAAKMVKVKYEDIKPLIVTIQDAIHEKSYYNQDVIKRGDVNAAFEASDHVMEGEMHMGGQEHFYMETNAHLAVPKGEDGEMEVFSSTQNPTGTQKLVAKVLGVPENSIVIRVKRMGGGFGGKETRTSTVSVPLCFGASLVNRPVRLVLDRDEDMIITGTRHPFLCRWKVGFSKDGILSAIKMELYANAGNSLDLSGSVTQAAMFAMDNTYKCQNVCVTGYVCKTNLPSNTAFRGFGQPQGLLFAEDMMSQICEHLKMDPNLVRERNMYQTGDKTHFNQLLDRCTIRRCWSEVIEQANYLPRAEAIHKFNSENRYRKRGISVIPVKSGLGFPVLFLNQAGALVHVYTDGSVLLSHGGTEMGQGLHTKMLQVAAKVLKISAEKIRITETSSDKVPNSSPTAASSSSDLYGGAVKNACETVLQRLQPYMVNNPKGTWESWVISAYFDRVSLSATGFYKTPGISNFNFETLEGRPFNYFSYGAAVTEVEIDCLTGDHSVVRTDIVMDVGESLNPAIDIGQIEGAFMQGLGLMTLEELHYSPEGVLLTKGPGGYKIPGFQDIPREFNISLLRGSPNPRTVFSSKGVGEPPLFLAASAFFAIKNAIGAVRADRGLIPVFRLDSPATAERIRMACQDFITDQIEPAKHGTFNPWSVTV